MHGTLMQHVSQEFTRYQSSVYDGTVATAQREIALVGASGNLEPDPVTGASPIDSAIGRIETSIREKYRMSGLSQTLADSDVRKAQSNAHALAINAALDAGKPEYAALYLKKYREGMDAADVLRVQGHIEGEVANRTGAGVAADVVLRHQSSIAPQGFDRMIGITLSSESGNRRYGADGKLLESPKGAKGEMQVMDGTNTDPGFGVKPAQDNSPEERARVGRDYLGALIKKYDGNPAMAWAAYNAGPGRLDEALKKADKNAALNKNDPSVMPKNWLELMPAETQAYVAKNMKALEAGQGAPARPTMLELDQQLMADPRLAGNPKALKVARQEAERLYGEQTKAMAQKEDESVAGAMRAVVENGGRYSELPIAIRSAIPPEKIGQVQDFAKRISKGDDTTSLWLYNDITANPNKYAGMDDNKFYALRSELSESDFKHFSQERAKLRNGQSQQGPGDLNSSAIKTTLDARLRMLNLDPTPKDDGGTDAARIGAIRQFTDQYFYAAQREAGKKFTDAEVSQHLDALFAKNTTFRGWFSNSSGPLLATKPGDIPSAERDGLKSSFKRMGIDNPTDAQILNAYLTMKVARK